MKNKSGISLIVLVITIIVMVVLVSAVVVTLSNTNIINQANLATETANLKQVEQMANVAWSEAYLENAKTDEEFEEIVLDELDKNGVNLDDYIIEADTTGVTVTLKPKLNEYGFYYNQLYYDENERMGLIFYQDGTFSSAELLVEDETLPLSSRLAVTPPEIFMGVRNKAQYSNKTIIIEDMGMDISVSNNGKKLIMPEGGELVCNFEKTHYTYKNSNYVTEHNGDEVKITIDARGNMAMHIAGIEYISFTNEMVINLDRHMSAVIGSVGAIFTSLDGKYMITCIGREFLACKRVTTKPNSNISTKTYSGTWETKKEFSGNKISKAVVTNGTKEIEIGTLINYMPNGVGPTSYKGSWRLFGTDDQGRLLIVSVGILEELTVTGKNGYDTIVSVLEEKAQNYKDGTIGISARNIRMQDLVDLLEVDLSKEEKYGKKITYSWTGTNGRVKGTYVVNGTTKTYDLSTWYTNGFTYKDEITNNWVTAPYVEGQTNDIATVTDSQLYAYFNNISSNIKLSSFLQSNAAILTKDFRTVTRLVANTSVSTERYNPSYGVYTFAEGLSPIALVTASGYEDTVDGTPCAIVTLSPNVKLRESATIAGGYDLSI